MHTHNMVHVLCIVCTVYAHGHTCVCVHICVLLYVHISAGETLAGTKLAFLLVFVLVKERRLLEMRLNPLTRALKNGNSPQTFLTGMYRLTSALIYTNEVSFRRGFIEL